jgi:hypothetical protein
VLAWILNVVVATSNQAEYMSPAAKYYPEQFATTPDLLHVAIPRIEIIAEMTVRGEQETLDDICLAVALVADAIGTAQVLAHT